MVDASSGNLAAAQEKSGTSVVVLKAIDFGVEKNLMRAHAVALENGGKDVVFFVETQGFPILVVVNGAEGSVSARTACAARRARSTTRRVSTGNGAAARAAVDACQSFA